MDYTDRVSAFMMWVGGNPERAIKNASKFKSVELWIESQKNQVSLVGGIAMLFPFVHLVALIFDFAFLLHKMSYVCWGIASFYGVEEIDKDDMRVILAHWSGEVDDTLLEVAVSESTDQIGQSIFLTSMGDQVFKILLRNLARRGLPGSAVVVAKTGTKALGKASSKLTVKYVAKLSLKFVSKFVSGFLPILGVVIAVLINRNLLDGIAKSAVKYYSVVQKHVYSVDQLAV